MPGKGKTTESALPSMVSNLPGIVYRCRDDGHRTMSFISDGVEEMTGYPAVDFIDNAKRSFASLIRPDDVARVEQTVKQGVVEQRPFSLEYHIITAEGEIRWVYEKGRGIFDAKGELRHLEGAILDITDREEGVQRLRANDERYRNLFDTSRDGIVFCTLDGRIEDANAAYLDMLGYSLEEARELTYKQITPEKWAALETDIIENQVMTQGYSDLYEKEYIRRDGTVFPVQNRAWLVTDKTGGKTLLMGHVRDVTELKRAEANLRKAHREHEFILQSAALGIFKLDRDANITFINQAALGLLGWRADALVGRSFRELVRCEEAGDEALFAETLRDGTIRHCGDGRFVRRDGSSFPISGTSAPMREGGRVTGAVVVFRDNTERMRTEGALRHSEMRLANAQRLAHLGSWETDLATGEEIWSDEYCRLLGLEPETCVPSYDTFLARLHPDDVEHHKRCLHEALHHDKPYSYVARFIQPSGAERIVEARAALERDALGNPVRLVGASLDVTERERAEAALRAAKERAEQASRTKSEFLSNMSHELRTPLNAIIGFAEMLSGAMHGPLGDERYQGYADDILESGRHLLSLINDILDLSRLEAGKQQIEESAVNLGELTASCMHLLARRAEANGVALESRVPGDFPRLYADGRRIKQIVLNLLSNAVKFTPEGGRVTVEANIEPGRGCILSITDTGIGMAPESIATAMEPFGQIDSALHRKYEGTGLGLPLVRELVELHGGRFELQSALGEGTTASAIFPTERIAPAEGEAREAG